jgi:hypothetical protein
MNSNKFKTVLCKHFGQNGTCSYGDKCQFAHGFQELKNPNMSLGNMVIPDTTTKVKTVPNPNNFKIVKCKNWETSGTCSYGSVCTFAHGDNEIRTKVDNTQLMNNSQMKDINNPYQFPIQDPNFLYNMMMQQQMMMMMGGMGQSNQQMDIPDMMNMNMNMGYMNPMQMPPNYGHEMNLNDNPMLYQGMSNINYSDYMNTQGPNNLNNMYMGGNNP